jgi:hypothetical protein
MGREVRHCHDRFPNESQDVVGVRSERFRDHTLWSLRSVGSNMKSSVAYIKPRELVP